MLLILILALDWDGMKEIKETSSLARVCFLVANYEIKNVISRKIKISSDKQ